MISLKPIQDLEYASIATQNFPTLASIKSALNIENEVMWVVPLQDVPKLDAELVSFAQNFFELNASLHYPQRIVWIQPLTPELTLTLEEAEQILGLIAGVTLLEKDTCLDGRECYVVGGTVRQYAMGLGLQWLQKDLYKFNKKSDDQVYSWLETSQESSKAIHFIELPENNEIDNDWYTAVSSLIKKLKKQNSAPTLGVSLPRVPTVPDTDFSVALEQLKTIVDSEKITESLACQLVDSEIEVTDSLSILKFAHINKLSFDFSVNHLSAMLPYFAQGAYIPLEFDLRIPAFYKSHRTTVIEMPRWNNWISNYCEFNNLQAVFNPEIVFFYKLAIALNRDIRELYLNQLNSNPELNTIWHYFNVYNWSVNSTKILRFLLISIEEYLNIKVDFSFFNQGYLKKYDYLNSIDFLNNLRQQSLEYSQPETKTILAEQINYHQYLENRTLTPDAEKLIAILPNTLGKTLEIGSGYGLTAQKVIQRTSEYIGIDLHEAQVEALNKLGGQGMIADMHNLPFEDNSFDTVIADNVLEHAYAPQLALAEIRRILKPQGCLYALIPLDYKSNRYQLKAHLWKADEKSIHVASCLAGLQVKHMEIIELSKLENFGCFPSCQGKVCLVIMEAKDVAINPDFSDFKLNSIDGGVNKNQISTDKDELLNLQNKVIEIVAQGILDLKSSFQEEVNKRDKIIVDVQEEVNKRDKIIVDVQEEVNKRDKIIVDVQEEVNKRDKIIEKLSKAKLVEMLVMKLKYWYHELVKK
ncbi:MAG: methyltransferase domain-containing protein [Symploca sp. SIO2C1]|nr:methyltransferase domain-containing protein [Symploca sp. SIO2C1]